VPKRSGARFEGKNTFSAVQAALTSFSLCARDAPTMSESNLPHSGIRVLELAQGIAGPFCGKLLAEFGAQLVKVEPPTGDISRHQAPFASDHPDAEGSLLYLYLNTAKRSITLSLGCRAGRRLFEALKQHADVIIADHRSAVSAFVPLESHLIYTSIRPFGMNGPRADWPFTELTIQALGGVVAVVGDPDRPPLKLGGEQASYLAGLNAAVATLLALESRERSGSGQVVDISMQESLLTILGNLPILYSHLATVARRIGSRHHRTHPTAIFPCRDGYVGIAAQTTQQWEALCLLIDQPELLVDARFITGVQRAEHADELDAALLPWFMARTRQEVMLACQAQRIPVGLSCTIPELLEDPQYAASTFFREVDHPSTGLARYPGAAFPLPSAAGGCDRAPLLGEHNAQVYAGWLGVSSHEQARLRAQGVL
jgi:crotonobetainyl-CoA:carnitine CoA-transferase CaiB-like acyl-CoA transferase